MTIKKLALPLFLGIGALALVYEVAALISPEAGDTISELTWNASRHPFVPFASGFLAGHFFWQARRRDSK